MYLLFNMLSRCGIAFLPRSKHLLISWPQSPSALTLEPKKIKPVIVSIVVLLTGSFKIQTPLPGIRHRIPADITPVYWT